jgi:hypothetical protein
MQAIAGRVKSYFSSSAEITATSNNNNNNIVAANAQANAGQSNTNALIATESNSSPQQDKLAPSANLQLERMLLPRSGVLPAKIH